MKCPQVGITFLSIFHRGGFHILIERTVQMYGPAFRRAAVGLWSQVPLGVDTEFNTSRTPHSPCDL